MAQTDQARPTDRSRVTRRGHVKRMGQAVGSGSQAGERADLSFSRLQNAAFKPWYKRLINEKKSFSLKLFLSLADPSLPLSLQTPKNFKRKLRKTQNPMRFRHCQRRVWLPGTLKQPRNVPSSPEITFNVSPLRKSYLFHPKNSYKAQIQGFITRPKALRKPLFPTPNASFPSICAKTVP